VDNSSAPATAGRVGRRHVVRTAWTGSPADRRRDRQMTHDLHHGLATVLRLVEAIDATGDLDRPTAERFGQLQTELLRLCRLVEEESGARPVPPAQTLVRVDVAATEVVELMRSTVDAPIELSVQPVCSVISLTGLWRAVRNLADNAVRAAGSGGRVAVQVYPEDGWAVLEVDDTGPGFGRAPGGLSSQGLGIVQDFVAEMDGTLTISQAPIGGCRVRLALPSVIVLDVVSDPVGTARDPVEVSRGHGTNHCVLARPELVEVRGGD